MESNFRMFRFQKKQRLADLILAMWSSALDDYRNNTYCSASKQKQFDCKACPFN